MSAFARAFIPSMYFLFPVILWEWPLKTLRIARPRNRLCAIARNASAIAHSLKGYSTDEIIGRRSEEHTSELQSQSNLVCRLLLEKKNNTHMNQPRHAPDPATPPPPPPPPQPQPPPSPHIPPYALRNLHLILSPPLAMPPRPMRRL